MSASNKKNAQDNTINIRNLTFANTLQEVKREKKKKMKKVRISFVSI